MGIEKRAREAWKTLCRNRRKLIVRALVATMALAAPLSAHAESYEDKPVFPACSDWGNNNPGLRAFVAVNPEIAGRSRSAQQRAFRLRGLLEWSRLISGLKEEAGNLGVAGLLNSYDNQDDKSQSAAEMADRVAVALAASPYGKLVLAPDNPLPLMLKFVEAKRLHESGADDEALQSLLPTLAQATRSWGKNNAGLVLGYTMVAEIQAAAQQRQEANLAIDAALAAIAAHPERAPSLSYYQVRLLNLRADMLEEQIPKSGIPNPRTAALTREIAAARGAALLVLKRYSSSMESPYFDILAMFPGAQPLVQWAQTQGTTSLSLGEVAFGPSQILSALIPSRSARQIAAAPNPKTAAAIPAIAQACALAVARSAEAGDFPAMNGFLNILLSLVSERNLLMVAKNVSDDMDPFEEASVARVPAGLQWAQRSNLKPSAAGARFFAAGYSGGQAQDSGDVISDDSDQEDFADDDEDDETAMADVQFVLTLSVAQGFLPKLADRLEMTLTPRAALAFLAKSSTEKEDKEEDEDKQRIRKAVRDFAPDLQRAFIYSRTAVLSLLRPANKRDFETLSEAAKWIEGSGRKQIENFLRAANIGIEGDEPDEYLATRNADLIRRWLPAIFEVMAWRQANALNDEAAQQSMTASIFSIYREQILKSDPKVLPAYEGQIAALSYGSGPLGDRASRILPDVLMENATAIARQLDQPENDQDAAASEGDDAEEEGEIAGGVRDAKKYAYAAMAYFIAPLAAREGRWKEIVKLGDPVAQEALKALHEEDEEPRDDLFDDIDPDEINQTKSTLSVIAKYADLATKPLAYYAYGLNASGRHQDLANLYEYIAPSLQKIISSPEASAQ